MAKIIKRSEWIESEPRTNLNFDYLNSSPGHGYSFEVGDDDGAITMDANGRVTVDLTKLTPIRRQSMTRCVEGRGVEFTRAYVQTWQPKAYREPAILLCDCGREVGLYGFTNTCDCGADYNSCGQRLAPRSQWGEETGESVADILSVDADPYAALEG